MGKKGKILTKFGGIGIVVLMVVLVFLIIWNYVKNNQVKKSFVLSMESIKNNSYEGDFHYLKLNGEIVTYLSNGDTVNAAVHNITYDIEKVERDKNSAIVTVSFNYPCTISMYNELIEESPEADKEQLLGRIEEMMKTGNYASQSCTTDILMLYLNKDWYIVESDEFIDVLTGGIYSDYQQRLQDAYNKLKNVEESGVDHEIADN